VLPACICTDTVGKIEWWWGVAAGHDSGKLTALCCLAPQDLKAKEEDEEK